MLLLNWFWTSTTEIVWSPTWATVSELFKSLVPWGTRYSSMPIPRIPTTTPSMIRTPIFFSRRASHTSENPPAQRYLEIPRFAKSRQPPHPWQNKTL